MGPEEYLEALDDINNGTIVIWSQLDRVIPISTREDDENAKKKILSSV